VSEIQLAAKNIRLSFAVNIWLIPAEKNYGWFYMWQQCISCKQGCGAEVGGFWVGVGILRSLRLRKFNWIILYTALLS